MRVTVDSDALTGHFGIIHRAGATAQRTTGNNLAIQITDVKVTGLILTSLARNRLTALLSLMTHMGLR